MHSAWCSLGGVPYCFSRSSVKFQGYMGQKIADFDPNLAFPDCYSNLSSLMAMKWCTKLEAAYKRWLIIFQGHPSNCWVYCNQVKMKPFLHHYSTTNIEATQMNPCLAFLYRGGVPFVGVRGESWHYYNNVASLLAVGINYILHILAFMCGIRR